LCLTGQPLVFDRTPPCADCHRRRQRWIRDIRRHTVGTFRPSLKNADQSKWETDYWEIAKVYMGAGQPTSATGPNTTDPIGIFQLIINCDSFVNLVSTIQLVNDVSCYDLLTNDCINSGVLCVSYHVPLIYQWRSAKTQT